MWTGGLRRAKGYVYEHAPDHPNATKSGYVCQHRLVMEKVLGRYLTAREVVHHHNGVRDDNRPENLAVFSTNAEHLREELSGRVPNWTDDGIERMKQGLLRKPSVSRLRDDAYRRTRTSDRST